MLNNQGDTPMLRTGKRVSYHNGDLPGWIAIFPLIFLGVGLLLLTIGALQIYRGEQSKEWPTVPGVITVAELGKQSDRDSDGRTSTTYRADISYDYLVNDTAYVNGNVHFGSMQSSDPSTARAVLKRYPVGKSVTVYYNPARPQQAVLEPGVAAVAWILPALGLLFAVVGSGFCWLVLRMLRSQDRALVPATATKLGATSTATPAS
jgi:hypothetical protein